MEFISFVSAKQIIFFSALFNSGLYRQSHGNEADAVFSVGRVETRLIKIENAVVAKSVQRGGRFSIEAEDKEP